MSEKNKGGRPKIVLSEEQRKELETLAAVLSTEQIADYFGIRRVKPKLLVLLHKI